MGILVATLGASWPVIPEVLAFTNPRTVSLLARSSRVEGLSSVRARYGIRPVSEVWVVTTAGAAADKALGELRKWSEEVPTIQLRWWQLADVADLASEEEIGAMAELIHRVVFRARWETRRHGGPLYLSLAGGRKTMSADLQTAGAIFGYDALLHVVMTGSTVLEGLDFRKPLPPEIADHILPVVISGAFEGHAALDFDPPLEPEGYPIGPEHGGRTTSAEIGAALRAELRERMRRADHLLSNFRIHVIGGEASPSFHLLYTLPPKVVKGLQKARVGIDPARREEELAWLRALPKADLHCHLGGVLDGRETLEVAEEVAGGVEEAARRCPDFGSWLDALRATVDDNDLEAFSRTLGPPRALAGRFPGVPPPLPAAGAILACRDAPEVLERWKTGLLGPGDGVGFDAYERAGDLQGSALLQSEATLRAAVRKVVARFRRDGVRYLELRTSPLNYTRGGLSAEEVARILVEETLNATSEAFRIRLLFIASRHRDPKRAAETVALARGLYDSDRDFGKVFAGFDLAGDEAVSNPASFREVLRPLLERCVRITIHAGETEDAGRVWSAVYDLAADRIGHGLSLEERGDLMARFRERKIAVELCPTSNMQVVGFRLHPSPGRGGRIYPLRKYLEAGLRVTVNTDNPGISNTVPSRELLRAAELTPGGLSRWEILSLVRDGFRSAFCSAEERRRMLGEAERMIFEKVKRR